MQTKAKTAEDIIGIVPHTLGYIPHESLVAIIVGKDAFGIQTCETTLRIDFSLETAAQIVAQGGQFYSDLISGACVATGVFLVLYDEDYLNGRAGGEVVSGDSAEDEYRRVHRDLVRAAIDELAESLAHEGIDTLSAWWVSEDRFGRIDDDGEVSTLLEKASNSACATELIASGSSPVETPGDLLIKPLSAEEFAADREGRTDVWLCCEDSFDTLSLIYPRLASLREGDSTLDRDAVEELMTLPIIMALDTIMKEKWSRDALEMILSFDHPNFKPSDIRHCGRGELFERAERYSASPRAAQEMVGLSPRSPRPRDIQLGIEFLKAYIPRGRPEVRATAYAVVAWFEWSLGSSTLAELYARAALEIESEHAMAGLVLKAVENGFLPQWLLMSGSGRR